MYMHFMKHKFVLVILFIYIITIVLSGCKSTPAEDIVKHKEDDLIDKLEASSTSIEEGPTAVRNVEKFTSTDGSIEFTFSVDQTLDTGNVPAVEAVPHFLTGQEIKQVAQALFGDAEFYERATSFEPEFSKSQLQKFIARWSPYTNADAIKELKGEDYINVEEDINILKSIIDDYTRKLETAPTENPLNPCDWVLKKERVYNNAPYEIADRPLSDDMDVIYATTEIDGIDYTFTGSTHDTQEYKTNAIHVSIGYGVGAYEYERNIFQAMLCRTEKPSEEQIHQVVKKAQNMLDQMNLGEWEVFAAGVQTVEVGTQTEYLIQVRAVPVFEGHSVLYGQPIDNSTDPDVYNAVYAMSLASFQFAPGGELITFRLVSPMDVVDVMNSNVATLPVDELMELAKNYLMHSDLYADYGVPEYYLQMLDDVLKEDLICKMEINELQYGLGRLQYQDKENHFLYVPVFACSGRADYYGKDTGTLYASSSDFGEPQRSMIWINAVDGTFIQ